MSGVLHPVGPEPTRVYWARRAVVIGVFLVLVAVIIALVANAAGGQQRVSAVPAAPTTGQAVDPTASGTATPSADMSASGSSPSVSPGKPAKASVKPTVPRPTASAAPKTKSTVKAKTTAPSKAEATAPPKAKVSPPKAKVSPKAKPVAAPCDPAQLRATLTGQRLPAPTEDNTFALSLINGSTAACRVIVTTANFELKIYSGKDRIWSTDDCSTAVKTIKQDVASEKAVGWSMTWNGRRSAQDCKNAEEIPRAGTYFATAQLAGAKPVQLRMILR